MRTAALAAALLVLSGCVSASGASHESPEPVPSFAPVPVDGSARLDRPRGPVVDLLEVRPSESARANVAVPSPHLVARERSGSAVAGGTSTTATGAASWYCGQGSPCTRGYPGGLYAAIRRDLLGQLRGRTVRVCVVGSERCVDVRVIDCNCGPHANLIDLYRDAFGRLASPSRGVLTVTVSW